MENEPMGKISQEEAEKFKAAFEALTDEEKNVVTYTHFHFSGEAEHKLPKQDELEKSAKEKLEQAGINVNELEKYLEA